MDKKTAYPIISLMPDKEGCPIGGTLRLGKYECALTSGTLAYKAYGEKTIWERHRHRYEFNNEFRTLFDKGDLKLSGVNPERNLVEIVEFDKAVHPWMLAVQFHPEFKSRPNRPHPLFRDFIGASLTNAGTQE